MSAVQPPSLIPASFTKGRVNYVWSKIHALSMTAPDAETVATAISGVVVPWDGFFLVRNTAGAFVIHLFDDHAPYHS